MSFWYFFLPKIGLYWQNLNFLSFSLAKFEIFELFWAFFDEIWIFWPPELKIYAFEGPRQPKNSIFCVFWRNLNVLTPSTLKKTKIFAFLWPKNDKILDFLPTISKIFDFWWSQTAKNSRKTAKKRFLAKNSQKKLKKAPKIRFFAKTADCFLYKKNSNIRHV